MNKQNAQRVIQNKQPVAINLNYGHVPPQATELEEAVLGAMMLDKTGIDTVLEILKPECFYVKNHVTIFAAITALSKTGHAVDTMTVVEQLKKFGELEAVGGRYFVTRLTNDVVDCSNVETHAKIILQKFMQRELIRISLETVQASYTDQDDVFDIIDNHEKQFTAITNGSVKSQYSSLDSEIGNRIVRIEQLRKSKSHITGVRSGFADIDRITHGWQPTDLIILAARPSVGKTALALNCARNAAISGTPVAFFSMEMSKGQLTDRLLSAESGIYLDNIANGQMDDQQMDSLYKKGIQPLANVPVFIDDSAALNIFELRSRCRRMKAKHGVGLIIIDYLQLMSGLNEGKQSNREQEISRISRELKKIAKELGVPVMALSQLSREPEKRKGADKMPQLSDLRESGAIEQDADMVMFLYRPEYYDQNANEFGESTKGETHVKIAKHRNGRLDVVKLQAILAIQKFENWQGSDLPIPTGGGWRPLSSEESRNKDLEF